MMSASALRALEAMVQDTPSLWVDTQNSEPEKPWAAWLRRLSAALKTLG